jgi:hypothetical protein
MKNCRECQHPVSEQAYVCPNCGAPRPAKPKWDGWGIEYKSSTMMLGMPLIHVSFKFRPNFMPVPARGVIAIGQFGAGIVNISQFGIGLFSLGQFCVGGWVLSQFAVGYAIIAQIGLYWEKGYGQIVYSLRELLGL